MSSPTSLKRPRTESTPAVLSARNQSPITDCTPSAKFWLGDGDICIRVANTLHLVPRIPLEANSRLFLPDVLHRLDSRQTYLNFTVYVPPCDDVPGWELLLMAVYEPLRLGLWGRVVRSDELFTLLQIAKDLKFDQIFVCCMQRLQTELPSTLDKFDAAYSVSMTGSMLKPNAHISSKEKVFKTINAALESGQNRALACAYLLALMEASADDVHRGICSPNGVRITLNPAAQDAILLAHAKIGHILFRQFSDMILATNARRNHCISKPALSGCRSAASALEGRLRAYITHVSANTDPIVGDAKWRRVVVATLGKGEWFGDALEGRCSACREKVKAQLYEKRQRFWEDVPMVFGLGKSWDELKNVSSVRRMK